MRKNLFLWQLFGLAFTFLLGTLFHFLYTWTGAYALAPFSAVNESTWEHMKILFFPMLIFSLIQLRFFKQDYPQYWQIKCVGITIGVILIPVLFYTYNGVFGSSSAFVNILFFFLSAAAAYALEYFLFRNNKLSAKRKRLALLVIGIWAFLFVLWTFLPPKIPIFQDPRMGLFGVL